MHAAGFGGILYEQKRQLHALRWPILEEFAAGDLSCRFVFLSLPASLDLLTGGIG